jgi:hypothetical protein
MLNPKHCALNIDHRLLTKVILEEILIVQLQ